MLTKSGRLVTFSGVDLAGKTTQISNLYNYIESAGGTPFRFWSRGGYTGPFNFLKRTLRMTLGKKVPPSGHSKARSRLFKRSSIRNTWVVLAVIDLIFIYAVYFRFLKMCGRTILADRYIYDTKIDFQINFPGLKFEEWRIWKILERSHLRPDCSFLLMIPMEEWKSRSKVKKEPFPSSSGDTSTRIEKYQSLRTDPRIHYMDCTEPEANVRDKIEAIFEEARLKSGKHANRSPY